MPATSALLAIARKLLENGFDAFTAKYRIPPAALDAQFTCTRLAYAATSTGRQTCHCELAKVGVAVAASAASAEQVTAVLNGLISS